MTLQDGKLTFKSPIFGDRPLEMDKVALLKFYNKVGNTKPGLARCGRSFRETAN